MKKERPKQRRKRARSRESAEPSLRLALELVSGWARQMDKRRSASQLFVKRGRENKGSPALLNEDALRSDVNKSDLESAPVVPELAPEPAKKAQLDDSSGGAVDLASLPNLEEVFEYDMFLSHLQKNAQNTVIAMNLFLKEASPSIRTFIDLETNMSKKGGLTKTLRESVRRTRALVSHCGS